MRVAELVEQGLGVVERDQHRLAGGALDEVVVVRRDRRDRLAGERLVAAIARGPRAGALALAREVVAVEQADVGAGRLVLDLPDANAFG